MSASCAARRSTTYVHSFRLRAGCSLLPFWSLCSDQVDLEVRNVGDLWLPALWGLEPDVCHWLDLVVEESRWLYEADRSAVVRRITGFPQRIEQRDPRDLPNQIH